MHIAEHEYMQSAGLSDACVCVCSLQSKGGAATKMRVMAADNPLRDNNASRLVSTDLHTSNVGIAQVSCACMLHVGTSGTTKKRHHAQILNAILAKHLHVHNLLRLLNLYLACSWMFTFVHLTGCHSYFDHLGGPMFLEY